MKLVELFEYIFNGFDFDKMKVDSVLDRIQDIVYSNTNKLIDKIDLFDNK